ncbi:GH3 family domain-containing protein [Zavarzinia sp. CC-PAN008]|uniref:GH3 family domain-containing protein n=1 Tax=Zavarzinia sp. CC-PAN008 TaxID=3243332 RepID=UPI003F742F93
MRGATAVLRLHAGRRLRQLARQDPVESQRQQLMALLARAAGTRFGRAHGFAAIHDVADYQRAVPLRRYEDFWTDWWREPFPRLDDVTWPGRIPYFALSSGTTSGTTKYIPCSLDMIRANSRAGLDVLCHHVGQRPGSRVMDGAGFMLGGSTALQDLAPGVLAGDLSGIAVRRLPWYGRLIAFPPVEVALLSDWEEKIATVARLAPQADVRVISGTPSWMLMLFDALAARTGTWGAPAIWPRLDLLVHGAVPMPPYRARVEAWLRGTGAETREVYPASEGFIAIADAGPEDGLRLMLDNGLFLEFVPVDDLAAPRPVRHWAANVQTGVDYAVVVTSNAGLWSYVLGDTVRFVSLNPHRVVITGRTAWMLSAFGEHVIAEEVEQAALEAARAIDAALADFAVFAVHGAGPGEAGGHCWIVEFDGVAPEEGALARFGQVVDATLARLNEDYRAHRAGMAGPRVERMAAGGFAAWMKQRGRLGGQNKVPRILVRDDLAQDLRDFATGWRPPA